MKQFLFAVITLVLLSCGGEESKVFPVKQTITESVYASITVQPDSMYQVYAIVAGILDENLVEEGELVNKHQSIVQIINNAPKLNTENARLTLELARENLGGSSALLSSIEEEINSAKLKYDNDSINYFRQQKLWDQNIGSKIEYDTRKLNYRLSKNSLELLKNKYDRTNNELETAVKQAQNSYRASRIGTTDFTVKSKLNGKLYALYKNPGEIVTTMEPLATIGMADRFIIEMLVDEVDIVQVVINQEVIISLDAYTGKIFEARVSKIIPKKDERNQTFTVEAIFNNPPKTLYPGLSGEANIIISTREDVLTIPRSYLAEGDSVQTENGFVKVVTGLKTIENIEVVSGISESTAIIKPE